MEKKGLIKKIKTSYILKNILNYIKNEEFKFILFSYSKLYQKILDIKLIKYKEIYLQKMFDINDYLHHEFYGVLYKKYNNFLIENKLNIKEFENIIYEVKNNEEEKTIKDDYEIKINIDSPLFDILSKTKNFSNNYTIYISQNEIDKYEKKDEYINFFNKLNKSNIKYASIYYMFNDKKNINNLKEFNIDFNKIKRMTLIFQKEKCENEDDEDEDISEFIKENGEKEKFIYEAKEEKNFESVNEENISEKEEEYSENINEFIDIEEVEEDENIYRNINNEIDKDENSNDDEDNEEENYENYNEEIYGDENYDDINEEAFEDDVKEKRKFQKINQEIEGEEKEEGNTQTIKEEINDKKEKYEGNYEQINNKIDFQEENDEEFFDNINEEIDNSDSDDINKYFFETLFSFKNLENNLIYLKIDCELHNIDPDLFKNINHYKSLKYLFLYSFKFSKKYTINLDNLNSLSFKYCQNIYHKVNGNLKELNLSENNIVNIKDVKKMNFEQLEILNFSFNEIIDINPLKTFNFRELIELYLCHNDIKDINVIQHINFENLEILDLGNNKIIDINVFENADFKELKKLILYNNYISDINSLEKCQFEKLEILNLGYNEISDINILKEVNFKKLKELYLYHNYIFDIKVLEKIRCEKLELLHLEGNKIDKIYLHHIININLQFEIYI